MFRYTRFPYYVRLAARSLRRQPALTALMTVSIGLGIGAAITTLTVLHVLSGDPLPGKSHSVYFVQLDPRDLTDYHAGDEPSEQVTRRDGEALLAARRADRQALMTGGSVPVQLESSTLDPIYADARYTTADFFPMFDVPFRAGAPWLAADDEAHARVAVIADALDRKLFGGSGGVGRTLRLDGVDFRIVGVLAPWRPTPHFYDLNTSDFAEVEQVFVPFSTSRDLHLSRNGSMDCWGTVVPGHEADVDVPCVWLQLWVELGSPAKAAAYRDYLHGYSEEQRAAGRFVRPTAVRLRNVMEWLDFKRVVPSDVRLQNWLAFAFLLVCMVNTVGLLLAKFLRRSSEIAIRRSLGASRRAVLSQFLTEAGLVGLAGGGLGLVLALLGLWAVRQQTADYVSLARLDPAMLVSTFVLAVSASLLAGLLPAWRACAVPPAAQLKSD